MFLYPIFWFLGFLYFIFLIFCACGLIYSLLYHRGTKRPRTFVLAVMCLIGLLPLLIFARSDYNTVSSTSGTYRGSFGGGTDTLTLRPNGTFSQQFVTMTGKVYTSAGKWRLHAKSFGSFEDTPSTINFDAIIVHADSQGQPQKPSVHGLSGASVNHSEICFYQSDEQDGNCYTK